MLFDLRGRGRRRAIKVIYVFLAFLMGGGLVFFGIGGDVSGGLFDVFGERGASSSEIDDRLQKRVDAALARTRANPKDPAAWLELTRTRVTIASSGDRLNSETGEYTEEGKRRLRLAASSWEKFLALETEIDDDAAGVASLMVRTYSSLGDLERAVRAQEIIADARGTAGAYSQLAILAYQAGQTRKGDLAAEKAIEETEPDMREALRGQLESQKNQGIVESLGTPQPSG